MKAHIESTPRDLKQLAKISGEGKVQKPKVHSKSNKNNMESMEIKAYLSKLQELVPFIPNDKKMSKLEVITHVIEYIRELRQTLGLPPSCGGDDTADFDMESMMMMTHAEEEEDRTTVTLTVINSSGDDDRCSKVSGDASSLYQPSNRQPLGVISSTANNTSRMCQEVAEKITHRRESS